MMIKAMNEIDEIISRLRTMRLPGLADAFEEQVKEPERYNKMTFTERLSLIVDREYECETNHRFERLIKGAKFAIPSAKLADIKYLPSRHLDHEILTILTTNQYIRDSINVIIMGATGSGKTYISNALGVRACEEGYKTLYVRLPNLFRELEAARKLDSYNKVIEKYRKIPLLIIDEFMLVPTEVRQQTDLLELMETRCGQVSTIFCSQYSPRGWIEKMENQTLAESIIDRIEPLSYKLNLKGDTSMRKIIADELLKN